MDSVWLKIWSGVAEISSVIWQGFLSLVSGNLFSVDVETNESFSGEMNYTVYANDSLGNEISQNGSFDINNVMIDILTPTNNSYGKDVSELNYSVNDDNEDKCWYSVDGGVTNSSAVSAGVNWTGLSSNEGSNTWIVYCNDTSGNLGAGGVYPKNQVRFI